MVSDNCCRAVDLGTIRFSQAYKIQHEALLSVRDGTLENTLFFCRHYDVITIGRSGSISSVLKDAAYLRDKKIELVFTDRGGDVTYHGASQLVAYPVFDLRNGVRDIHLFLRRLEEAVIGMLAFYGVLGVRKPGMTGVWVDDAKICSIGVAFKQWISYHGVSVNIGPDLEAFSYINPCGMKNIRMVSLSNILGRDVDITQAKSVLASEFAKIFNLVLIK